ALHQRRWCTPGHRVVAPGSSGPIDGGPAMSAPIMQRTTSSPTTNGKVSWYEASARTRLRLLLDAGSFLELIGPEAREVSPHLKVFDLPEQFDDGIVVGRGRLDGAPVFVAAQEGRFMGGAFGEIHGAKLTGLLRAARN